MGRVCFHGQFKANRNSGKLRNENGANPIVSLVESQYRAGLTACRMTLKATYGFSQAHHV
jgi:hypothetical protein